MVEKKPSSFKLNKLVSLTIEVFGFVPIANSKVLNGISLVLSSFL